MLCRILTVSLPMLVVSSMAWAQPYRYEMTLMPDGYWLEDVNNNGEAVGWYRPSGQVAQSFVWTEADGFFWVNSPETPAENVRFKGISDDGLIAATAHRDLGGTFPYARAHTYNRTTGQWTMVHPWSGCSSEMQDMSSNGKFCGEVQHLRAGGNCGDQFSQGEAFVGEGVSATTIGRISQYPDWAHAVNNNGDVCGEGYLGDGFSVRGTYRPAGGTISALPGLGGTYAFAYGLNDHDVIAGYASRPGDNDWVAVSWTRIDGNWTIEDLTPGNDYSTAWDVNNSGLIAGTAWFEDLTQTRGVIWFAEEQWDLNTLVDNPTGVIEEALAISDTGWIVAWTRFNGDRRACILKPIDQDTDGDGILDSWETLGVDINGDGVIDLDLPSMGATPDHKDLFVEIDRMQGAPFWQGGVDEVVAAFDDAPLTNPDGMDGIRAHLMVDESDLPFLASWDDDFVTYASSKAIHFGTPAERADPNWANIKDARERVFRYCAVINSIDGGALGIAETPGNDMMVALGAYGAANADNFGSTLMHELGHMLNLHHGGGDGINYKPNYISCMNYNYDDVFAGNGGNLLLDFSREALPAMNESALDETASFGDGSVYAGVYTLYGKPDGSGGRALDWVLLGSASVDWNDDGTEEAGVVADVNWFPAGYPGGAASASAGQTLSSYNDWELVVLPLGVNGPYQDSMHVRPPYNEMTIAEREWLAANVPPPTNACVPDLNGDGVLDNGDIGEFVTLFLNGDLGADFNADGILDNGDIGAFVAAYLAGC